MKNLYTGHLGPFDYQHKNPPAPFNPDYKPHAARIWARAVDEVWKREGFSDLTLTKRAAQLRAHYDALMAAEEN